MSAFPLRLSCQTAYAVPSSPTVTSGKSLTAAVLSVTLILAAQAEPPTASWDDQMLFWLARRSTHTAVSAPAAVPAMRGLRWTEPPPPPDSSLTLTSGETQVWLAAVRFRKKMSGLPAPLRSSCHTAYALLAASSAIAGVGWMRV